MSFAAPTVSVEPKTRKVRTSATVLYMSMSLDGFIAGPNERPDNPLGDGGERLHEWPFPGAEDGANRQIYDELMATGAIVTGSGSLEPAGGWGGDHHDGVPIFIYSRREPGIDIGQWPLVTYVTDVSTAIAQANEAAGDKNVLVHGAAVAQLALAAGVLDELEIHLIPVLLGPRAEATSWRPGRRAPLNQGGGRGRSRSCTLGSRSMKRRTPQLLVA
jgi:dihydrofolate reductase